MNFGRNVWPGEVVLAWERKQGLETADELPPFVNQQFLEKRYNRSSVTMWRWVQSGYFPAPKKLGVCNHA